MAPIFLFFLSSKFSNTDEALIAGCYPKFPVRMPVAKDWALFVTFETVSKALKRKWSHFYSFNVLAF